MRSNLNSQSPYQGTQSRQGTNNKNNQNSPKYQQSPQRQQRQYNQNRQQAKTFAEQPQQKIQVIQDPNKQSIGYFCMSIGLFLIAFIIFGIVWAVQKFALNHQVSSHYYIKSYQWISATPALFQIKLNWTVLGFIIAVVFQWMTWKIPLAIFSYNCIRLTQGKSKWITYAITVVILLAVDVVLHLLLLDIYNSYMYFGFYTLVTVLLAVINNTQLDRTKIAFIDSFLPLLYIGVVHAIQVIALPILYKIYQNNLDNSTTLFLIVYLFPIFDLIMYSFLLFIGSYISKQVKIFHQQLHFLTLGYSVGTIMLVGYTEVQFYYLISYYIFRNVFCNYVMYKWDQTLNLPPALPLWILPYFFSYVVMFLPFCGVGNVITSVGYYSFLLVNTNPILYIIPNSMHPNAPYSLTTLELALNTGFTGQIFWLAAPIIWLGLTFSQKYSKKKPQIALTIFYNIFGIYLFYLGLSSALATQSLTANSLIS